MREAGNVSGHRTCDIGRLSHPVQRSKFIEHKGTRILYNDFSGLENSEAALEALADTRDLIAEQPEGSLLTLTNVAGTNLFETDVATALYELLRHNKPYVRAAALVGIAGQGQDDLYHLVTHQARRKFKTFDDLEEAKDWLVEQG